MEQRQFNLKYNPASDPDIIAFFDACKSPTDAVRVMIRLLRPLNRSLDELDELTRQLRAFSDSLAEYQQNARVFGLEVKRNA